MMLRRAVFLLCALTCVSVAFAYTLIPPQQAALVRVWTEQGSSVKYLENPTELLTSAPVAFVALDTDEDSVFDRAGVPDEDGRIVLYPAGMVSGIAPPQTQLTISCAYPGPEHVLVSDAYTLVLPAGDCVLKATRDDSSRTYRLSVEANAVTSLDIALTTWRSVTALTVIVLLAVCLSGWLVFWFVTKRQKKTGVARAASAAHGALLKVLRDEERSVVEYLRERGPQLAGVVRKDLQIPKTTFHRVLWRLKEKQLVVEEEFGNTTRLSWNESFHSK